MKNKSNGKHLSILISTLATLLLGCAAASTGLAAEGEDVAMAGEYSRGAKLCMTCHKEGSDNPAHEIFLTTMGSTADPGSPFADGNHECEACHGPSLAHTRRQPDGSRLPPPMTFAHEPVEEQNAVCLSCHADGSRFHWPGSTHDLEAVSCMGCHDVHAANDAVMSLETQPQVCYDCHQEQRSQFLRQSRHPVQGSSAAESHIGLMSCSDCHAPHGSTGPGLLVRSTINDTCFDCHAEKRGPFLFEHAPVREDCTNCHVPHGSNHENLLTARQPWMCQQCHIAQFHPSTAFSGTGVPPAGAAQQILGKSCMNCHTQIHGSNHPGGIRQTR